MDNQTEGFVSGPLATVLRVTRFVGMAPLRFQMQGVGWRASLSRCFTITSYLIVTAINLIFLWNTVCVLQVKWEATRNVFLMDVLVTTGLVDTMVYCASSHMRCLIASVNRLQRINSQIKIPHCLTPRTRKELILCLFWGGFSAACVIVNYGMQLYIKLNEELITDAHSLIWHNSVTLFLHFSFYVVIQLGLTQFILLVLEARYSLKACNDSLRHLLKEDIVTSAMPHRAVRLVSSAYSSACTVVRDVDSSFGLMLIMMLSFFFLHLIISPYYFCMSFVLEYDKASSVFILAFKVVQFFWCVYLTMNLMMLVEPCHLTRQEMESTQELVSQLMMCAHSAFDPLAAELDQFRIQLQLNDVSYKPLQITTITRGIVLTILGSITTYLLILVETDK